MEGRESEEGGVDADGLVAHNKYNVLENPLNLLYFLPQNPNTPRPRQSEHAAGLLAEQ
jgi:hypothetical protein